MEPSVFDDNRIIIVMRSTNEFTEESLKRIYRAFCKKLHPDTGGDTSDFVRLTEEYEQAKSGLPWLKDYYKSLEGQHLFLPSYQRLAFYLSLQRYKAAGLYSVKVRIRENLLERNRIIIEDVVKRAQCYDESFVPFFLNFNRNHLKKYSLWLMEKNMKSGRSYFLKGLSNFLDYQLSGRKEIYNIATSYLEDSLYDLQHSDPSPVQSATVHFASWLLAELHKKSLYLELKEQNMRV